MNIKDTDIGRLWPWTVPDPLDMPLSWQTSTNKAHKTARLASNSPNMLLMKMSVAFCYYHTQLKYPFGISITYAFLASLPVSYFHNFSAGFTN